MGVFFFHFIDASRDSIYVIRVNFEQTNRNRWLTFASDFYFPGYVMCAVSFSTASVAICFFSSRWLNLVARQKSQNTGIYVLAMCTTIGGVARDSIMWSRRREIGG